MSVKPGPIEPVKKFYRFIEWRIMIFEIKSFCEIIYVNTQPLNHNLKTIFLHSDIEPLSALKKKCIPTSLCKLFPNDSINTHKETLFNMTRNRNYIAHFDTVCMSRLGIYTINNPLGLYNARESFVWEITFCDLVVYRSFLFFEKKKFYMSHSLVIT